MFDLQRSDGSLRLINKTKDYENQDPKNFSFNVLLYCVDGVYR
jgi:hypothetical protein